MSAIDEIRELFDSGDPHIRSWFLVSSYAWPPLICFSYLIFVRTTGSVMKNIAPFELRNIMIFYNSFVVIMYVTAIAGIAYQVIAYNLYYIFCEEFALVKDSPEYKMVSFLYIMYLLKYVELFDTVFFTLRRKRHLITNLHVIHHASFPIICWLCLRTELSGYQIIPAIINGFVHIIMYSYYCLAAMGPNVQKRLWWKPYLTRIQMVQFIVVILFSSVIVPLSGCHVSTYYVLYMNFVFALLFLILFYNYYIKTYPKPSENGVKKTDEKSKHTCNNNKIKNGK